MNWQLKAILHAGEPGDVDRGEVILRFGADEDDSGVGYSFSPKDAKELGIQLISQAAGLEVLARVSGAPPFKKDVTWPKTPSGTP